MTTERGKVAVFGDLTSLFSARSRSRRSINYAELDQAIKSYFDVTEFDETQFFTLVKEDNEKQNSFISGLENLGWEVKKVSYRDVRKVSKDTKDYRFDPLIGYELASAVDSFENIVIITDSIDMYPLIQAFQEDDDGCKVHLAFFSDCLDSCWIRLLTPGSMQNNNVEFIDLSKITH